ncbi:hypothetical protein [Streptomyces johnsoniae]|uniref:Uncharacterized protein n=1 Tax=Streptomyces johnsoniae TaxID=3075532 RepID=A0ABU2S3F2_9ACTN|nr:hypothetical protein [Streptomyces sp. DSM 41886]MDT0443518.1 hypothetical protein [Streptomyces sp. DSM 41886]
MSVPQTETPEPAHAADPKDIASTLGIPPERVTPRLLANVAEDPLFLHHLELCRDDPELLDVLLASADRSARPVVRDIGTPELLSRAGAAVARWAASGFRRVSEEVYQSRTAACRSCVHLSYPPRKGIYRLAGSAQEKSVCGQCGCDVRRKAWLPAERCPDGRWEAAE